MKRFYIYVVLIVLTLVGLTTPARAGASRDAYLYFHDAEALKEQAFFGAIKKFHERLKQFRVTGDRRYKDSMQRAYESMKTHAHFPKQSHSYKHAKQLLSYAKNKLTYPKGPRDAIAEPVKRAKTPTHPPKKHVHKSKSHTPSTAKPTRHQTHHRSVTPASVKRKIPSPTSQPRSPSGIALTLSSSNSLRPSSPLDTKKAAKLSATTREITTRELSKTPRRQDKDLSPSSWPARAPRSTSTNASRSNEFQIKFVSVTPQNGLDCTYHAAKTAKLIADNLEQNSGVFYANEYRSPSSDAIRHLKSEFERAYTPGRTDLDGEKAKQLLDALFEGDQSSDAAFFLRPQEFYVCAQVDYDATVKAQMAVVIKGCELIRNMQRAEMTAEDGVGLLIHQSTRMGKSGHVEINERAGKTYRKNDFTLHTKDLFSLLEYQAFLHQPHDSPLLPLAEYFAQHKNLLLVWQRHSGHAGRIGHWITILITSHTVYVFDSLNQNRLPSGFEHFFKNLPKIPSSSIRSEHQAFLATLF